jgi:hypothetical protein
MSLARLIQMGASGVVTEFSPSDISDLQIWLDSSDTSYLFQDSAKTTAVTSDNDPIGCWADRSGNGYDHIQATSVNRPTLDTGTMSLNSINFDRTVDSGVGQFLQNASSKDTITIFIVMESTSTAAGVYFGFGLTYNAYFIYNLYSGTNYVAAPGGAFRSVGDSYTAPAANTSTILTGDLVQFVRKNGTQYAMITPYTYTGGSGGGTYVGRRGLAPNNHAPYLGNIGEIITYDRRLSSSEIDDVEAYLSNKWSITI